MAEPLKKCYSEVFFNTFLDDLSEIVPTIDKKKFLKQIFYENWDNLELKQRMSHIAFVLSNHLAKEYPRAIKQILHLIRIQNSKNKNGFNFEYMFCPEFIIQFGLNDFETSILAMEKMTQFTSCEFAVRHFLNRYPEKMCLQMIEWSNHTHPFVRRLASEGMRTKLPWAIKVPYLYQNVNIIFQILEKLIFDKNEWVLKSVANNLNDLSKDFPDLVLDFIEKHLKNTNVDVKTLKHASRTLLKNGNTKALSLFGIFSDINVTIDKFNIQQTEITIGDFLRFDFEVINKCKMVSNIRLEYKIYFQLKNKKHYGKIFKISDKKLSPLSSIFINEKHSFKIISTRNYNLGEHYVSIVLNGNESRKIKFILK
jgi:3-methyladenine DNA glycosylase AlkC